MATEKIEFLEDENRAQVVEPKGTAYEEPQVAYAPTPVAEGDWRNVPGDWKTSKGSSRTTLTEIREEQAESYRKARMAGVSAVRRNPTVEVLRAEAEAEAEASKPVKKAAAKK